MTKLAQSHDHSHLRMLLFSLSLSLLPIYTTLTRSLSLPSSARITWLPRLGLDQLHLILLQLIFTYFFSQRWSFTTPASTDQHPKTHPEQSTTTRGIAKNLLGTIDKSNDWSSVYPTVGIEVLKHKTINSLYAIRTEFEPDHGITVEQLVRCINETKQWEWDKMCESGEDLGDGITWVKLKGFWPIKPKELVMRSCIFRLPHGKSGDSSSIRILAASTSTTHPTKKSTLEIKFAGYLIETTASGGICVTQIIDLSGFGALPTFVTKAVLTKFVPSSLRKLVGLAQERLPPNLSSSSTRGSKKANEPTWMPPYLDDSSASLNNTKNQGNEQTLNQEINQLKQIIHDLKKPHSYFDFCRLSLSKIPNSTIAIIISSVAVASVTYKKTPSLFSSNNRTKGRRLL
ncbi:hypothetical protein MJO28_010334 [Puccinia striiformis f. sp. tritici]|nr:hypothetical protein Pst134EA_019133 [Puccinia striiformis f. sp. tritici]KNF05676.1 hypothetical protein PSTG_01079 [Puccinia striiformis f. sp. tritici PST-78]POW21265.1 hypothetical protein PSHT_02588 [Puccinia striiformis]KAH9449226.1 hypothetical protein Pst134EB_020055 [Puccinia striiformis f. sp. tritici]KAH9458979.1 hypothetical protein Pst134EA_019133 [Puccinia striiformis f. sp. tritici]KAI7944639.1 hypothetical protein MJO28_010334 [Puccinia striiformis f. sp. tritici]